MLYVVLNEGGAVRADNDVLNQLTFFHENFNELGENYPEMLRQLWRWAQDFKGTQKERAKLGIKRAMLDSGEDEWVEKHWNPIKKLPTRNLVTQKLLQSFIAGSHFKSVQTFAISLHVCASSSSLGRCQQPAVLSSSSSLSSPLCTAIFPVFLRSNSTPSATS